MASASGAIIRWWEMAYLEDEALQPRFMREASAALPVNGSDACAVYDALDWRRLRLRQDQQVPEWTPKLINVLID